MVEAVEFSAHEEGLKLLGREVVAHQAHEMRDHDHEYENLCDVVDEKIDRVGESGVVGDVEQVVSEVVGEGL